MNVRANAIAAIEQASADSGLLYEWAQWNHLFDSCSAISPWLNGPSGCTVLPWLGSWIAIRDGDVPLTREGIAELILRSSEAKALRRSQRSQEWLALEDKVKRDQRYSDYFSLSYDDREAFVEWWCWQFTAQLVAHSGFKRCWITDNGKTVDQAVREILIQRDSKVAGRANLIRLLPDALTPGFTGNPGVLTLIETGGSVTAVDGTGRPVSSSPPGADNVKATEDQFYDGPNPTTLTSPAAPPPAGWYGTFDDAGTAAPDVTVPSADMPQGVVDATGNPLTASTPATGGGTTTNPTSWTPVAGGAAGAASNAGSAEIPEWAIYLAVGIVVLMVLRK